MNDRRNLLSKIADNIYKHRNDIAQIECIDTGKPYSMSITCTKFSAEILRYYAGWTDKKHG